MAKFAVTIVRNAEQIKTFEIEAPSEEKAEEIVSRHIDDNTLAELELIEESIDEVEDNGWDINDTEELEND